VPYTANEGPVRIQYKWLVPIYVFPEMKMLFPKQNYNVLSPSSYTHVSVRDLYISRIGLPILLQETCGPILEYIKIAHRHMNVVGTEAAQFPGAIHKWDFLCSVQTTYCGTLCKNTTSLCHKSLKIRKNSHTRRNCGFIKGS
jgi:hypothetical protein